MGQPHTLIDLTNQSVSMITVNYYALFSGSCNQSQIPFSVNYVMRPTTLQRVCR